MCSIANFCRCRLVFGLKVWCVAWSASGKRLATCGGDKTVRFSWPLPLASHCSCFVLNANPGLVFCFELAMCLDTQFLSHPHTDALGGSEFGDRMDRDGCASRSWRMLTTAPSVLSRGLRVMTSLRQPASMAHASSGRAKTANTSRSPPCRDTKMRSADLTPDS